MDKGDQNEDKGSFMLKKAFFANHPNLGKFGRQFCQITKIF